MNDAEINAARLLLARLGVKPEELVAAPSATREAMPLIRDYVTRVSDAVPAGTRRVYSTYWRRVVEAWGDRRIDEPTPLEIKQLAEDVRHQVVVRKNSRGGRTAAEHLIASLRCLYQHAIADELLSDNPAKRVAKPRRLASTRRAIPDARLAEINYTAGSTGSDPELDLLLLRLHTETACRRGGALALRPQDLDPEQSLVRLREKGETVRWQPVSPTLMRHLISHHEQRGDGQPSAQLLRYRNGRPITARRYDHLWQRIGRRLPWVATQQVSTHWLRHTTLTWVERNFGYAVARAYAGHDGKSDAGTTSTYVRADLQEVAAALAALTGEPHPAVAVSCADKR
ncbi:integrase [Prauserella marina]|uniref:Site-specific recombinase XerD n=1 Tax=Prauserella marina TaxID=530584 RepID=A0A222VRP0_9PSEU|nr:site-specific integrase [Prauserella marina]ASR36587.1 integrase [Prauserella marina]PWV73994.1 site-specific recombinase XerD [Prauserella marina]SDD60523.1 Site-specific recombinase XerD [Prauserella marina]